VDAELEAVVLESINYLEDWLGDFTSRASDGNRHFPAGFLARGVAYVRGIEALRGKRDDTLRTRRSRVGRPAGGAG
jgi:hypothetical protein